MRFEDLPPVLRDEGTGTLFGYSFVLTLLALLTVALVLVVMRWRAQREGIRQKYTLRGERPAKRPRGRGVERH